MIVRLRTITMIAVPVLLVGAGIWFFAHGTTPTAIGAGGLPLIKADTNPVKLPPEDPGGEVMPNADSTVLAAMSGEGADPSMQDIQPPSETGEKPMPAPAFAGLKTGFSAPAQVPERSIENLLDTSTPEQAPAPEQVEAGDKYVSGMEPTALEKPVQADQSAPKTEAAEKEKAEPVAASATKPVAPIPTATPPAKPQPPKPAPKKTQEPEAPKPQTEKAQTEKTQAAKSVAADVARAVKEDTAANGGSASGGTYYIQLASMPAGGDTAALWARLRAQFPTALAGLSPSYQQADIPGRGAYIRVQAGPLSQSAANDRCRAIRAANPGVGCLVVRR
ncbi:MAG: SPOR domain-containing protein [Rhodospirillales bacterium]|nr:SPOR domain-containing protein [Alphaproteobacteria bacterium]MCB9987596.1 SPOR domain-containing protein [Rhodospirillales bacterium]USO07689.1 MAG: SPOR domain-containing protein [Rhodospirillales bacterium]